MSRTVMKHAKRPTDGPDLAVVQAVSSILQQVREKGDTALRELTKRFDGVELDSFRVSDGQLEAAVRTLPQEVRDGLDFAKRRVTAFAEAQRRCLLDFEEEISPGVHLGHRFVPVASCGSYVPAGRYPCMSSPLMSIIPPRVAGVRRIVALSPPDRKGQINAGILYAMKIAGADEIYALGGAQAIAALAYGTETIYPVDIVVGPGNRYVMEAKRQVYGAVGIDLLAGPSEVMVIADGHARAEWVAADILAQCEHDPQARGALVTTSRHMAEETLAQIEVQLRHLSTEKVARQSWDDYGEVVLVSTLDEAAAVANEWAPEHLEVHTVDPQALLPLLSNYGSLFLGEMAAEVFADKNAGTNSILPTLGGARYCAGLGVGRFLKCVTHQWVTAEGMRVLAPYTAIQSAAEGMDAHRAAAAIRMDQWAK
jgi:sulfopropanediol 3-dehydrogenase